MDQESHACGKICIVKFHENQDTRNRNKIITRTLGKFGVVSTAWYKDKRPDQHPQAGEFWKVKIIKEVGVGTEQGCFVLIPLEKTDVQDLDKLLPGFYRESFYHNVLIITPNKALNGSNWILPLAIRKNIQGVYSVIVDLVTETGRQRKHTESVDTSPKVRPTLQPTEDPSTSQG